jgi:outer membrane lipoprotein-sorting protein
MLRLTGALALAVVCLVGAGQSASQQQAVDDLVLKNLDAKGGLEKLKAITTIKQTGTLSMQGSEASLLIYSKRPNMQRQEISVAGKKIINGFDGLTAWIINPLVGAVRPIQVTGPQADMIREQSAFDGPLVDYKNQGVTIELVLGTEMMGDQRLIHLKLTSRTQQVTHLYLDAVTYLDAKMTIDTAQMKLDQQFWDYREQDGIKVPFLVRTIANGVLQSEMKLQSVEFNAPIDEAVFKMPKGS